MLCNGQWWVQLTKDCDLSDNVHLGSKRKTFFRAKKRKNKELKKIMGKASMTKFDNAFLYKC